MGSVFSRNKPTTVEILEKLEVEISEAEEGKRGAFLQQRTFVGYFLITSFLLYLASGLLTYFKWRPSSYDQALIVISIFLVVPVAILGVWYLVSWCYSVKVDTLDRNLEHLRQKQQKILDNVKNTETYKVAMDILERFDPENRQLKNMAFENVIPTINRVPSSGRRAKSDVGSQKTPVSARLSMPARGRFPQIQQMTPVQAKARGLAPADITSDSTLRHRLSDVQGQSTPASGVPPDPPPMRRSHSSLSDTSHTPSRGNPGPPPSMPRPPAPVPVFAARLPRPIPQAERGFLDKLVDYLVADGPNNRFALVCRQCCGHNGMAFAEEFEYLAFRCCYCFAFNPARKQKLKAPSMHDLSTAEHGVASGLDCVPSQDDPSAGVTGQDLDGATSTPSALALASERGLPQPGDAQRCNAQSDAPCDAPCEHAASCHSTEVRPTVSAAVFHSDECGTDSDILPAHSHRISTSEESLTRSTPEPVHSKTADAHASDDELQDIK